MATPKAGTFYFRRERKLKRQVRCYNQRANNYGLKDPSVQFPGTLVSVFTASESVRGNGKARLQRVELVGSRIEPNPAARPPKIKLPDYPKSARDHVNNFKRVGMLGCPARKQRSSRMRLNSYG